jgi:serine/threonine protein kinase/O-acetyl-ADP-ribose deacetylase (regulator of RNase III)
MDRICDAFEAAWKAGQRPLLEDYLQQHGQEAGSTLLRELLTVELQYRRRRGEPTRLEEYRLRFPQHAELLQSLIWTITQLDEDLARKYELIGEAGRGAMGVVYRARHKILDLGVAIKVMQPDASTERFLREARLLAKIKSPNIVAVHDFDLLRDGRPVLVMEWVEGTDLGQALKAQGGPLPEARVIPWMRQTCAGMLAAAEQGIIHRDLKPSNVLIDAKDCARVGDFGLARESTGTGDLSQAGLLMGTPHYMAPEQAEDPRGVDTRADIYSFGATFYHLLTGKPPFEGDTPFAILFKNKTEPLISPRARQPELSERISDVLERCLAKAPTDRFPSFAEILKHLQPDPGVPAPWVLSDDRELADYLARFQARRAYYLSEQADWNEEMDTYRFPRAQVLRIVRGDIVSQEVEALVSSDTCLLEMDSGVSGAIRQAAGAEIDAQLRYSAPVRPGRAFVTSAGRLSARLIFHGVTVGFARDEIVCPSRDLIVEIMTSCMYHADSHSVKSIAFPLLGTGAQGFPRDICLETMFQFLCRTFLRGLTSVNDARIVIYRAN